MRERVQQAFEGGDIAEAIRLALEAWRAHPAACVADVLDALDEAASFDGPSASTKDEFHVAWCRLADAGPEALATGWLAANLTTRLPLHEERYGILRPDYAETKFRALLERMRRLVAHGPDPRIARALMALVVRAPYSTWDPAFADAVYGPMIDGVAAQGDVRQLAIARGLIEEPKARTDNIRQYLAAELPERVVARLARVEIEAPADAAEWRELVPRRSDNAPTEMEAALLAAVRESVEDDDKRLVFADALQTRGDPRGDFIALQLVPEAERTAAMTKRIGSLLRKHKNEWLGEDLSRVLGGVEFRRGFLTEAALAQNAVATPQVWERAAQDPRLATLEVLNKGRGNTKWYTTFVTSAAMTALAEIEIPSWAVLDAFGHIDRVTNIAHLRCAKRPRKKHLDQIAAAEALANVDGLTVVLTDSNVGSFAKELTRSSFGDRIRLLRVREDWRSDGFGAGLFEAWKRFPRTLRRMQLASYQGEIELHQTEQALVATVRIEMEPFVRLLAALPEQAQIRVVERGGVSRQHIEAAAPGRRIDFE